MQPFNKIGGGSRLIRNRSMAVVVERIRSQVAHGIPGGAVRSNCMGRCGETQKSGSTNHVIRSTLNTVTARALKNGGRGLGPWAKVGMPLVTQPSWTSLMIRADERSSGLKSRTGTCQFSGCVGAGARSDPRLDIRGDLADGRAWEGIQAVTIRGRGPAVATRFRPIY